MINDEQNVSPLEGALNHVVKVLKGTKGDATPDFYDTYADSVKVASKLRPHAEYDYFPDELFAEKAPNQTAAEFTYQKGIYQPVTVPYFHKAANTAYRIWNEQNYDIIWGEGNDEQRDYFYKQFPFWGNLESYYKQVVTPRDLTDPNAVIVHVPINLAFTEEGIFDDSKRVEVIADLYPCERVWLFEDDTECIIASYEHSMLDGDKTDGLVLWYFDKNEIYKLTQYGKKQEYTFNIELYYAHNRDKMPCRRLGGIPIQRQDNFYFQSFFSPVVPALNQALCDSSTLSISKYSHAFLQKWEYVDDCEVCDGSGNESYHMEGFNELKTRICSGCHGAGAKRMFSASSVYQVQSPTKFNTEKEKMAIPPAGFIDIDHGILDFLQTQVEKNIQSAFELLSIDVMNSDKISGRETATGKAIDREELYSFLLRFSETVFNLFEFSVNTIGEMRFGKEWQAPSIRYPQNFEMRTDTELTEELKAAPDFAKPMLAMQYAGARFATQESKADLLKISFSLDYFFGKEVKDVIALVSSGIAPKWKATLHNEMMSIIREAIAGNATFMDLDAIERQAIVDAIAQARTPDNARLTPEQILSEIII